MKTDVKKDSRDTFELILICLLLISVISSMLFIGQVGNILLEDNDAIRKDIRELKFSLNCEKGELTYSEVKTVGRYFVGNKSINLLVKDRSFDQVYKTFLHEWGHHVWHNELSKQQQESFCSIEAKQNVTKYASDSCSENFAETFAYYNLGTLKVDTQYRDW